jgi:hypothetical protein
MGNAKARNGNSLKAPETPALEASRMPDASNSSLESGVEVTEAQRTQPTEVQQSPEAPKQETVDFEKRLGNDGSTEIWNVQNIIGPEGKKVYLLAKQGEKRFAMLPEAEFKIEQELREATEKFANGKAWGTLTALLTEEGKVEHVALQEYLDKNKGRILEFAAWMSREYKISPEQALEHTKEKVKAVAGKETGEGYFELDYAVIAKAMNEETSAFMVRQWGTEDAKLVEQEKNAATISAGLDLVGFGSRIPSEMPTGPIEMYRATRGDEKLYQTLVKQEITEPAENADLNHSLEEMRLLLVHDLEVAIRDLQDENITVEALRENERIMLESLNLYRIAAARKMVEKMEDLDPTWKRFLRLSAEEKAKKGVVESAGIPTETPAIQKAKRAKKLKTQEASNSELKHINAEFGEGKRIENVPGDSGLDEVPAGFVNLEPQLAPLEGQKSPMRREPAPIQAEEEKTSLNIAPNAPMPNAEDEANIALLAEQKRADAKAARERRLAAKIKVAADNRNRAGADAANEMLLKEQQEADAAKAKLAESLEKPLPPSQMKKMVTRRYVAPAVAPVEPAPGFVSLEEQAKRTAEFVPSSEVALPTEELPAPGVELTEMKPEEIAIAKENARVARSKRRTSYEPRPLKEQLQRLPETIADKKTEPLTAEERPIREKKPDDINLAILAADAKKRIAAAEQMQADTLGAFNLADLDIARENAMDNWFILSNEDIKRVAGMAWNRKKEHLKGKYPAKTVMRFRADFIDQFTQAYKAEKERNPEKVTEQRDKARENEAPTRSYAPEPASGFLDIDEPAYTPPLEKKKPTRWIGGRIWDYLTGAEDAALGE